MVATQLRDNGNADHYTRTIRQFRKFIESMKFNRKERRRMFHAVTHGGAVVIQSYINTEYDNGETEEFVRNVYINRPSILRNLIAVNHGFRFKYDIVEHFDPKDKIILCKFIKNS